MAPAAALGAAYMGTRVPLVTRAPVFWDEGLYAAVAGTVEGDFGNHAFVSLADGKGPLQSWLAAGLLALGVDALTAVRLLALAAGAVTLVMVFRIAADIAGAAAGYAAAMVYVLVPMFVVHDSLGLIDPLVAAAAATALHLQIRHAREPTLRAGVLLGLALAVGLWLKPTAFVTVALLPLGLLICTAGTTRAERIRAWLPGAALAAAVALALQSVLRLSDLYTRLGEVGPGRQYRRFGDAIEHLPSYTGDNLAEFAPTLLEYLTVPVAALVLAGAVATGLRHPRTALVLGAWFAVPVASVVVLALAAWPRYLLTGLPAVTVLAGIGAAAIRPALRSPMPAVAVALLATLVAAPALAKDARLIAAPDTAEYPGLDDWQYVTGWPSGGGLERIADALDEHARGDHVVVATDDLPPYGLGALIGDPRLIPTHRIVWQSAFVVETAGRSIYFAPLTLGGDAARARLLVHTSALGPAPPRGLRALESVTRPRGGETTTLFERPVP